MKRQYSILRSIGCVGVFIMIILPLIVNGVINFIYIPSFIFVLGITFFILLANFGKDFLSFIPDSFLSFFSTPEPNEKFAEISKFGNRYAIVAGTIGTIAKLISILQNLEDPSMIGPAMAISLLYFFYAIIVAEFYFTYMYKIYLGDKEYKGNTPLSVKATVVPSILILLLLTTFFILVRSL